MSIHFRGNTGFQKAFRGTVIKHTLRSILDRPHTTLGRDDSGAARGVCTLSWQLLSKCFLKSTVLNWKIKCLKLKTGK